MYIIYMAWVIGGKHFGQYTYEHWFDHEFDEVEKNDDSALNEMEAAEKNEPSGEPNDSTVPDKSRRQP